MPHQVRQFCCGCCCVERVSLREPRRGAINKGTLTEAKLPHDPDRVVFHTPDESWQHHESRVAGIEEDSEGFSCGWDDLPSHCIIRQLRQLLVLF